MLSLIPIDTRAIKQPRTKNVAVFSIVVVVMIFGFLMVEGSIGELVPPLHEIVLPGASANSRTISSLLMERKDQIMIHAYNFTLNHEYMYSSFLSGNESTLYIIHMNSSTSQITVSLDIVLKSNNNRNCSLWIGNGNQPPIPHRAFESRLHHKHSAFRLSAPNVNDASTALTTVFVLVANESPTSSATSSLVEFGLTITISQFALRGGTIAFLVLLGIVVIGIALLLVVVALVHCTSKRVQVLETHNQQQQEDSRNKIEMTPIHYQKMTDEEEV
ncbi:hypothetical protein FDP41_008605 [Naegleria fowleri]|uniref:Uncharacterized protein n=2 Tax=Naegleria fowleri TaxID=5763 RepID=A0A6A5BF16_NAEFO|nr:uncharacterized protein FDP41_008605 [Naegleria fowleri]KAF0973101.1 hypothetical protein FDP41_008605 [Naegleria fowleri]CAG4713017.1 unnamed protein product [Naegleria fowleri]